MKTQEGKAKSVTSGRSSGHSVMKDLNTGELFSIQNDSVEGKIVSYHDTEISFSSWGKSTRYYPGRRRTVSGTGREKRWKHSIPDVEPPKEVPLTRNYVEAPSEEEVPPDVLPCIGELIVASKKGYWNIELSDESRLKSSMTYIGNNQNAACIKNIIGEVVAYPNSGYMSGLPARWAFEDGFRKFSMPQNTASNLIYPYKSTELWRETSFGFSDTTSFPHYGYSLYAKRLRAGLYSMAYPGGVFGAMTYTWFSKNYMGLTIESQDCIYYDTTGMDHLVSGNSFIDPAGDGTPYIRMIGLEKPIDCETSTPTSGDVRKRILDLVNKDRVCEYNLKPMIDEEVDYVVASDYAQVMSDNDWFNHVGPPPDETTLEERAFTGGLTWTVIGEVLAVYDDPGLTGDDNLNAVADAILAAWKASEVHWNALMSNQYFRGSFAVIQNPTSLKWYACGVIRSVENDQFTYEYQTVYTAHPQPMAEGDIIEYNHNLFYPTEMYEAYRAFSTVPREEFHIMNITKEVFNGSMDLGGAFWSIVMSDNYDWYSDSGRVEQGHGSPFNIIGPTDFIDEYPQRLFGQNGAHIRHSTNTVDFCLQYNEPEKLVKVVLEPFGDETVDVYPGTPLCGTPSANNGGNTSLHVGSCLVDHAQNGRFHGAHQNPFQTITVASVFHSNSGYTVLTYTMPETLCNDFLSWDDNGDEIQQRYWKIKQSLWCAVVHDQTLLARWEVTANGVDYTASDTYDEETLQEIIVQGDPQDQVFTHYFNRTLVPGSVQVRVLIDDYRIIFGDNETGTLTEAEYQHPDTQFVLADSDINFDTGSVSFTFGTYKPDIGTDVIIDVVASSIDNEMLPVEAETEIVGYEDVDAGVSDEAYIIPTSIKTSGVYPAGVYATITEDGKYVVLTHSLYQIHPITQRDRILGGPMPRASNLSSSFNIKWDGNPPQLTVYSIDPLDMDGLTPKLKTIPMYMIGESLTETLVLN